jgi:hypothetical protein
MWRYTAFMPELDNDTIRHALRVAREHGFSSVSIKADDTKFKARLGEEPEDDFEEFAALEPTKALQTVAGRGANGRLL